MSHGSLGQAKVALGLGRWQPQHSRMITGRSRNERCDFKVS